MDGKCAGTVPALLSAAEHQRRQGWPRAGATTNEQRADAFRRMDLVPADTDQIDPRVLQRKQLLAESLRGVEVQHDGVILQLRSDAVDRLNDPGLVVHVHNADEQRV